MDKAKAIREAIGAASGMGINVAKFEATLATCGYRIVPNTPQTLHSGPQNAGKVEPDDR